ncbi:MAG: hypothetical protein QNJ47_04105 [Nostocaceae cyanobacterium]|nr:hypothetical protein [Nostocaceae cyanobacterium]
MSSCPLDKQEGSTAGATRPAEGGLRQLWCVIEGMILKLISISEESINSDVVIACIDSLFPTVDKPISKLA